MAGRGIGAALRAARKPGGSQRLSQTELAKKIGVGQPMISLWESDAAIPNAQQLVDLAAALACSVDELVRGLNPHYDKWLGAGRHEGPGARTTQGANDASELARLQREHERQTEELRAALVNNYRDLTTIVGKHLPKRPPVSAKKRSG